MRTTNRSPLAIVAVAALILNGCGGSTASRPATTVEPVSAAPIVSANPSDVAWNAMLLVGRRGATGPELIEAATGSSALTIPAGSPAAQWRRVVTVTADGDTSLVSDQVVQPGFGGPTLRIPGRWQLPTVGLDPVSVGRSLDGSRIALVEGPYDPAAGISRFAILEHHLDGQTVKAGDADLRLVRTIELRGAFEYDTLSPDGTMLYVVEHLDAARGGAYQVRVVDIGSGVMRPEVIVDKTNLEERMAGAAIAQVRRDDGIVLTLYNGPEHPFIHALNSKEAWAVCIDLPGGAGGVDGESLDWGLATTPSGGTVYAVNASLGIAVDVDPGQLKVRRTASLGTTARARFVLAKFGHADLGPIGRRVVVSPDGSRMFAAGSGGLAVIGTADLEVERTDLVGSAVDAVGITPDGSTLFALVRADGRVVALDPASGRELGRVPGDGFDRLLAVAPW